jgi:signal peptidase I
VTDISTPPPPQQIEPTRHHHELAEMVQSLMCILVIATFVTTFLVQPHRIPTGSMEPTLLIGDFVLVTKNGYTPQTFSLLPHNPIHRGEIIVFFEPHEPDLHLVKRIIGLPSDRIHLDAGRVFINGQLLQEPYAVYRPIRGTSFRDNFPADADQEASLDPTWLAELHRDTSNGDLVVPPHEYFVLGDNRNDSLDSRYWGFVPEENILGEPWLVYFSLRDDGPLPPEFSVISQRVSLPDRLADRIVNIVSFARWDRTLHLVR